MKSFLEIELERQVYYPGEKITGKVNLQTESPIKVRKLILTFHAEEVLGADAASTSLNPYLVKTSLITPLIKDEKILKEPKPPESQIEISAEEFPFEFIIPENSPASFSSGYSSCLYFLTARAEIPMGVDIISKSHITIFPRYEEKKPMPIDFGTEEENLKIRISVEKDIFYIADSVEGIIDIEYPSAEQPSKIIMALKALEESLEEKIIHKRELWNTRQMVELDVKSAAEAAYGKFSFPIPRQAPFSYQWNTFKVSWYLELRVEFPSHKFKTVSSKIEVRRKGF
ncbi:MAG: hypothetical protein M1536_05205 [Firmicutes bacterium]|nr:hypothetical protein [Bacillota bacterium]